MVEEKYGYLYLMTNPGNTVLYTGVTSDIKKRIYQHRQKELPGFTKKYNVTKLVYVEKYDSIVAAIAREKQIKAGSRLKKIKLIEAVNPGYQDLYDKI